jgi:uncharacterized membrane protein
MSEYNQDPNQVPQTPPQEGQYTPPQQAYTPPQAAPQKGDPNATSDDRLWAMLAYLFSPLVPVILLLLEDKKNRPFIKAHTIQALAWGIVALVVGGLLSLIPFVGCIAGPAVFIISIIFAVKAYNGEYINIPVITDFVRQQGW